jgi:hypothetical protein
VHVLAGRRLADSVLASPATDAFELRYIAEKFTVIE